jgi:anti-sigma factor RsiW
MPERSVVKSSMNCADVRELIGNDLDRELTTELRARLHRHMDSCAACRAEARSLAESLDEVRRLGGHEAAAPWFADRALDKVLSAYEAEVGQRDDSEAEGQLELWPAAQ